MQSPQPPAEPSRIPTRAEILKQQLSRRRYFDSGDYAMAKADANATPGDAPSPAQIGHEHPAPDKIPHRDAMLHSQKESPVRRGSCLGPNRDD